MFSPYQVLPFLDIISNEIITEVRRDDNVTDDPEAIEHNTKMYNKVMNTIDTSLSLLRGNGAAQGIHAFEDVSLKANGQSEPFGFEAPKDASKPIGKTPEQIAAIEEVRKFLKGEKSKGAALTMNTMVNAATPILNNFDEVLSQPNLDKYNATLNTSPIVGLAGRAIRYLNKTATGDGTGTITESWAHLDNLPAEADTTKGEVHMFPYFGSFYLSVGRSLWRKEPRPMTDSKRAEAKNNWPKLYLDGWKKVGDQCMPAADLVSVAAHAESVTADAMPTFNLFIVDKDGKVKVFKGNDLKDNMTFSDVTVTSGGKPSTVKFKNICYYAGKLYGIDTSSYSWSINPKDKDVTKLEIKDKTLQATTEALSSNEEGLIALRNKKLYRQRVSKALDDEERAKEDTSWNLVIDSPEITHIGVAAPGSLLDLKTLTQMLRDQYLKTQVDVMPMVRTISRSSKQHLALLRLMSKDADEYEKASDDSAKAKIKERAVARGVQGALKIATTINKASVNASNAIVNMGVALRGISKELTTLQKRMEGELATLKKTLESQQGALKKIRDVQFWSLVVILISAVLIILTAGVAAPAVVIGLGCIFAAAFIVNKIYESKESEMMSDIAKTEASISSLNTSLKTVKAITPKFGELEIQYQALNMFWGRMTQNSGDLLGWTKDLADELFDDMFSSLTIETAKENATDLESGSQKYLDMLNAQGIIIPESGTDSAGFSATFLEAPISSETTFQALIEAVNQPLGDDIQADKTEVTVLSSLPQSASSREFSVQTGNSEHQELKGQVSHEHQYYIPSRVQLLTDQACVSYSDQAIMALDRGDFDAFEGHMDVSTRLLDAPTVLKADMIIKSGKWFDIDLVKQGVSVWLNPGLKELLAYNNTTLYLDGLGSVSSGSLLMGAKFISGAVVMDTIKLAGIMQDWAKDINKDMTDEQKLAQAKPYLSNAAGLCGDLANVTAKLNNGFNTINHAVTDARNKVVTEIKAQEGLINSTNSGWWQKMGWIQDEIPMITQLFWSRERLMKAIQDRAEDYDAQRRRDIQPFEDKKATLEKLRDSGVIYQNQHLNWVDLVQKISMQFGRIWSTLVGVQSGIKEDIVFNSTIILEIDWPELKSNAQEVLSLLNVPANLDLPSMLRSGLTSNFATASAIAAAENLFSLEAPAIDGQEPADFESAEAPMQFALQAHPVLETSLSDGANETREFFKDVRAILVLPHVQTIKGYENTIGTVSIHSGMSETITMYVRCFVLIGKALNRLRALSAVQGKRLKKLESKDIEWMTFYKGTQQAIIDASRYVGTAKDGLEKSYKEFQSLSKLIKDNRDMFDAKIKPVDALMAVKQKEVDDYIFQLGADAAAVMFVGAAAGLAVVAGPTVAFKAASAALEAANKVDGFNTRNIFKTFYSKMNWDEFKASMTSLSALRDSLKTAVDSLDGLQQSFSDTLKYGKDLESQLRETQQRLTDFETARLIRTEKHGQDAAAVLADYLKDVNFEELIKGWDTVGDRSDYWNDVFNAQGYLLPNDLELK
ncbi:uncharacterized protein PV07_10198 [Cladophialophora immunda]|uniref:Uncharacterized protein n=1 Tax=Cladophialophora immunda TaxID=569365 RepID=A0A0D2AHX9_9EURO|nr:uncharacterized protein PV07_10198 [Cladophialophora immunda]KIW24487.1 hypothetical protein PV07_10198 [Cladophialophora immunda]